MGYLLSTWISYSIISSFHRISVKPASSFLGSVDKNMKWFKVSSANFESAWLSTPFFYNNATVARMVGYPGVIDGGFTSYLIDASVQQRPALQL